MFQRFEPNWRDDDAAMARLRRDLSAREEEHVTLTAETERLRFEIDRYVVRAPIDGTIGDVSKLRVGSVAMTGDRCATIVPAGELTIVAGFSRGTAVGRIRPGQRARVRLTGFSWVQYGSLEAVVTRVASEASSDRVRVELSLESQSAHRIPIQNGLPATVEVELERVAPLGLILRAVGRWIEAA